MPDYLIVTTIHADHDNGGFKQERIVRAKNRAAAIKHVIGDTLTISEATIDDAVRLGCVEKAQ